MTLNLFLTKTTSVIGMNIMKAKGFPRYIKFKINYGKVGLNISLNKKHKNQRQEHEICKTKVQIEYYFDNT
jgi:hypothetical protein